MQTADVPVDGGRGPHPVHLLYHGGGWIGGIIEEAFVDLACRERTGLAGFVTVAVEYRLAPEHKFPVLPQDSYACDCQRGVAVFYEGKMAAQPAR